mmetsp:Transcript_64902/g.183242  ORF Transcript_64902/g.183242 Transcript_64902/m.183242 type:complete len:83 (+) Transcript_64902:246-494(+)
MFRPHMISSSQTLWLEWVHHDWRRCQANVAKSPAGSISALRLHASAMQEGANRFLFLAIFVFRWPPKAVGVDMRCAMYMFQP